MKKRKRKRSNREVGRPKIYTRKREPITFYIDKPLKRELKALCFVEEVTMSDKIVSLIKTEVESRKVVGLGGTSQLFSSTIQVSDSSQNPDTVRITVPVSHRKTRSRSS